MTPELIESVTALVNEAKAHAWNAPGTTACCCVLELKDGFTVIGKSQCPPDGQPFSPELGCKLAFDDAVEELMRLELYRHAMKPRVEVATPADVRKLITH